MKREALKHPKMFHLAALLGCSRPEAIGYVTLLLDWVADYATAGDVGRYPNSVIASACDFTGNPDQFVDALVASGWLDAIEPHRLVVHDWSQHCENWVRAKAQKLGIELLNFHKNGQKGRLKSPQQSAQESDLKKPLPARILTNPIQSNPTPSSSEQPQSQQPEGEGGEDQILIQGITDLRNGPKLVAWLEAGCAGLEKPIDPTLAVDVIAHAQECLQREIKRPLQLFWKKMRRLADTGRYDGPMEFYTEARKFMANRPKR